MRSQGPGTAAPQFPARKSPRDSARTQGAWVARRKRMGGLNERGKQSRPGGGAATLGNARRVGQARPVEPRPWPGVLLLQTLSFLTALVVITAAPSLLSAPTLPEARTTVNAVTGDASFVET